MRWFARRLVFYVFALWVALTINFLLPRLMPGDPIGGILQHLSPSQLAANPGIIKTYQALLGGGNHSIWQDYVTYLHRIVHFDFGISTSNYPTPVSDGRGADAALLDLPRRRRLLARVRDRDGDRDGRRLAPRRRRRQRARADVHGARRVPGVLHGPARALLLRAEVAAGSRSSTRTTTASRPASTGRSSRARYGMRSCRSSSSSIAYAGGWVLNMRTVMINTIGEDYVTMAHAKGLRDRRVMTRYAGRNAILPPLNGFAALFASAVGGLVFVEYIFSYPGAGLTLQQAVLGNDYAARAGDARRALGVRDRREPDHGRAQPRPRPAPADRLMSQLEPTLDPTLDALPRGAPRGRAGVRVPGWVALLLREPEVAHRARDGRLRA